MYSHTLVFIQPNAFITFSVLTRKFLFGIFCASVVTYFNEVKAPCQIRPYRWPLMGRLCSFLRTLCSGGDSLSTLRVSVYQVSTFSGSPAPKCMPDSRSVTSTVRQHVGMANNPWHPAGIGLLLHLQNFQALAQEPKLTQGPSPTLESTKPDSFHTPLWVEKPLRSQPDWCRIQPNTTSRDHLASPHPCTPLYMKNRSNSAFNPWGT